MLTLLKLLKDGRFHSGQALGAALGISRSAVWKQLQRLEADLNLSIHKVRGRGYQLAAPLELLERDQLADSPYPVFIHESLDSTNAEALREISGGVQAPFVILAEQQSAGRGRRGRKWISPFAENIYYSLVLRIDGGMRQLEGLSLIVGLAVLSSLREFGSRDAGLKWPNDVLVGNKKIAGILLELVGDPAD
ncbi:biotin--[acetyl-CoA-carboxylase] ligase, partial [Pseudomonas sp. FSL R10-0071]